LDENQTMKKDNEYRCAPTYRVLNAAQIDRIHTATLELLETVGVKIMLPEAVDLLAGAGCRVVDKTVVRIPGQLVEDCIRSAPSEITVYNRLGQEAMQLAGRNVHFGLGTDLLNVYDLDSGELRPSRLKDVAMAAAIGDALPEIDFIASYALPQDSPANLMYIDCFSQQLKNAVKPIFFTSAGPEDLAVINAMAAAAVGGQEVLRQKPIHIHYAEPLSPLTHTSGALKKLFFCADHRVPVNYTPGMMSGATAPITLAGAITTGNAEALSGIVLHQLRAKGAPIISGFGMSTFDMKTSACIYGCPEYRLAISACADLYHHYQIPMWGTAGASDSHALDQQAAMEWTASLLTGGLDGANLIHDVAYLGQGLVGHPAAIVMCAEIISYVRHLLKGFDLDDSKLDLESIGQVGPQGNFLTADQTLALFRTEHWRPQLTNRKPLESWLADDRSSWGDRAVCKAKEIAEGHLPPALAEDRSKALDELRRQAESKLADLFIES
jgi:trimethylamine--corrinoid protein Co-methyltransferase